MLAQRCGEWITNAPQLEEDVALANIGLDLLGQARTLLTYAGEVERREGRAVPRTTSPTCATSAPSRNVQLVELPNGDFAVTMARLLAFSTYQLALYEQLQRQRRRHARRRSPARPSRRSPTTATTPRAGCCGSATAPSESATQRMQAGLEQVWPYVGELFDASWIAPALIEHGVAVDVRALEPPWRAYLRDVLAEATLEVPDRAQRPGGGRRGIHTEAMGYLLAEMQYLHRSHPGARW